MMSTDKGWTVTKCATCGHQWNDLRELVEDLDMDLCRYRACFDDPADGVLVMTHEAKGCEATVEIPASALRSLYRGPSYSTHNRGNPTCMRKCMNPTDFSRCDNHCAMQWVREVIQLMRQHSMSEVA